MTDHKIGPGYEAGCPTCSSTADGINGDTPTCTLARTTTIRL
jgi:predicted dithiol-disulfide oxidoreductase (DUF899 family)